MLARIRKDDPVLWEGKILYVKEWDEMDGPEGHVTLTNCPGGKGGGVYTTLPKARQYRADYLAQVEQAKQKYLAR